MKKLILTGESAPPDLRRQLQQLWNAESFNRYGLTEAGSVASECRAHPGGMHLLETEFIAELGKQVVAERSGRKIDRAAVCCQLSHIPVFPR